jgi:hypothetical protein
MSVPLGAVWMSLAHGLDQYGKTKRARLTQTRVAAVATNHSNDPIDERCRQAMAL